MLGWWAAFLAHREGAFQSLRRLEYITFDARVRMAQAHAAPANTNLALVEIDERSVRTMSDGTYGVYGIRENFPWRRFYYGRAVRELADQGARVIAFDVLFSTLEHTNSTDATFAQEIRKAGNVLLAEEPGETALWITSSEARTVAFQSRLQTQLEQESTLLPLFRSNAAAVGSVKVLKDSDGLIRRFKVFETVRRWHPAVAQVANALNLDLKSAEFRPNQLRMRFKDAPTETHAFELDGDGRLNLEDLGGGPPQAPYRDERVWQLGIAAAAVAMGLDLDNAEVEPGRIVLSGPPGLRRVIPTDRFGYAVIDWQLRYDSSELTRESIASLIASSYLRDRVGWPNVSERSEGDSSTGSEDAGVPSRVALGTNSWSARFRDKLVIIGATATGGNVTDLGPTPLDRVTPLLTMHLNVANGLMLGRFVRSGGLAVECAALGLLGLLAAWFTLQGRTALAPVGIGVATFMYLALAYVLYASQRYWLPVFLPLAGGLWVPHLVLLSYRLVLEQRSRRHVRAVFAKVVAPEVVDELLQAKQLALGGARRKVTVLFADVRGFTEMTDSRQAKAEDYVATHQLTGAEAETYFDEQARETLNTVNLYLAAIADSVKRHQGTLDKYIGDCVMAFWGAPTANDQHALGCVRAAIEAQRTLYEINQQRFAENQRREQENPARLTAGQPPWNPLPLLTCGTGINTGECVVGLMGSADHIFNYTVFGREVNLASRLEGVSGRGRIIISETTYRELMRDDPTLAASCVAQPAVSVKGIRGPVRIFEVPWRVPAPTPAAAVPVPSAVT